MADMEVKICKNIVYHVLCSVHRQMRWQALAQTG